MNRKNRTSGKSNASKGRGEPRKNDKREKHPFQKFVKDKPDREKRRSDKPVFSHKEREERGPSGAGREERRPPRSGFKGRASSSTDQGKYRKSRRENPSRDDRSVERKGPAREAYRDNKTAGKKPYAAGKGKRSKQDQGHKRFKHDEFEKGKAFGKREEPALARKKTKDVTGSDDGLIRLNKYLSNAGVASRRDADNLIISGAVKVNGIVVNQLGTKIKPSDKVTYGDQSVQGERKVYLLLNKPKDYITTMDDPRDRKTVMHLVAGACRERVYPVGRLDRNTTGLLLLTNDGELAARLTHPKYGVKKVYHVSINKGLKPEHFKQLTEGVELEDGMVKVDDLAFVGEGKKEIGIELHSGKNRVVRRLFEHLGYDVIKLDRVVFAGLTKKDLPRGKYRFLSPKEVSFLKMIG